MTLARLDHRMELMGDGTCLAVFARAWGESEAFFRWIDPCHWCLADLFSR